MAPVDDGHPVAELIGLFHVVGGEEDGLAFSVELAQDLPHGNAALGIQPGGGFIEEQHRGPVHDGTGHHQPLGHAARKRQHRGVGPFGQAETRQKIVGLGLGHLHAHPEVPAVENEVLAHIERPVEGVGLRYNPDE